MVKHLQIATNETFASLVLEAEGPIVVEFMSYSCEHCRAMEPFLEKVAALVGSRVKIIQVNMATDVHLGDRYGVHVTPTLIMFYQGYKIGQVANLKPSVPSILTAITLPFRSLP